MRVCRKRLQKEYLKLQKDPVPHIEAVPDENNIREWHYVLFGPKDTPYYGGVYHGRLVFPEEYPYKPPSIYMITKSGRFKTNTRLCLSISDFHPETWNPLWSVGSILNGLLSFMLSSDMTTGSIRTSDFTKRKYAKISMQENIANPKFQQHFPHLVEVHQDQEVSNLETLSWFSEIKERLLGSGMIFPVTIILIVLAYMLQIT